MSTTATGGQNGSVTANIANNAYHPTRPIVRIHLFGSMRATSYLGDDVLPRAKKARAALAYLCLVPGARVSRTRIASMLWDRVSANQARTSFRKVMVELTSAMGSLAGELISAGRATVSLNTGVCWIDALALVKTPYSDDSTRADLAVLCAGELLEGVDDVSPSFANWLAGERVRFKERLAASLDGVLHQINRGDFDAKQVASLARRIISFDPTHQGASRALMRALAKLGDRQGALCEFERCREALLKAFNVKPALESERLYKRLRGHEPRKSVLVAPATFSDQRQRKLPERGRLRVGVSPFSAGKTEKSLAISLCHEVAAGLSRFRWFDVIATPRDEYTDLDYVVDGSISAKGSELRISVRLLDLAGQVKPVWSERFDIAWRELHRLDELVTTCIVARIDPIILHIEGRPKRRERYGATGLLLQAIPMILSMEREQYEQAGELVQQAIALEPDNARAEAWAAHWHNFYIGQRWAKDIHKATEKMQQHALRAITLDPENAEALGIYAFSIARMAKDFDKALLFFDRALRLNPGSAFVWALSAATYCYIGEPDEALRRLRRYRKLGSPHLYYFECLYTIAYTFKGDYERAVLEGRRAVKDNPNLVAGYKPLIASLGHLGRRDEAQAYLRELLCLEPNFTVESFAQDYSFKRASDRERYIAGLRLAGVPER
jgi:DNA-binding SARP family transcriptional activator/Flp pilus assembly protein TadD